MTTGEVLRASRLKRGQTLKTLSEQLGISITYLGEIERGSRHLTIELAGKAALALDYSPREFVTAVVRDILARNGCHYRVELYDK